MARRSIGETRQARISLLFTQTLYEKVSMLADSQGVSLNSLIESLIEKAVQKNASVIEKFQAARQEASKAYKNAD